MLIPTQIANERDRNSTENRAAHTNGSNDRILMEKFNEPFAPSSKGVEREEVAKRDTVD